MKYTLTLTEQQIAVLGAALQELSFRVAAPVINAINQGKFWERLFKR